AATARMYGTPRTGLRGTKSPTLRGSRAMPPASSSMTMHSGSLPATTWKVTFGSWSAKASDIPKNRQFRGIRTGQWHNQSRTVHAHRWQATWDADVNSTTGYRPLFRDLTMLTIPNALTRRSWLRIGGLALG